MARVLLGAAVTSTAGLSDGVEKEFLGAVARGFLVLIDNEFLEASHT